jgi:hypothetical protein
MSIEGKNYSLLTDLSYSLGSLKKDLDDIADNPSHPIMMESDPEKLKKVVQEQLNTIVETLNMTENAPSARAVAKLPYLLERSNKIIGDILSLEKILNPELVLAAQNCQKKVSTLQSQISKIKIQTKSQIELIPGLNTALLFLVNLGVNAIINKNRCMAELEAKITLYKSNLKNATYSTTATCFCETTAAYAVDYLEEHLLHIKERDSALRPQFLEKFFENPYSDDPQPTPLGKLVIPLLKTHKDLVQKTIEANVLQVTATIYQQFKDGQKASPYFFVDLVYEAIKSAMKQMNEEQSSLAKPGVNTLTIKERNLLLSGTFQKTIIDKAVSFVLPEGATQIITPPILTMFPGSKIVTLYFKETALSLVKEGFEGLISDIFSELSDNTDLKRKLLITGYEQTNAFLSNTPTQSTKTQTGLSKIGIASLGVIFTFFSLIFTAFRHALTTPTVTSPTYPNEKKLTDLLERLIINFTADSKLLSFISKHYSGSLARKLSPIFITTLQNISFVEIIDAQLKNITDLLSPKNKESRFPRKVSEEHSYAQKEEEQRKIEEKTLIDMREDLGKNISGLIHQVASTFVPDVDPAPEGIETVLWKIRKFTREFLQACVYRCVQFIFWACNAKSKIQSMDRRFNKGTKLLKQDVVTTKFARLAFKKAQTH